MIIGHDSERQSLESELPPAVLLQGPRSTGKRTLAEHVISHHRIHPADSLTVRRPSPTDVRNVTRFLLTRPMGRAKVVMIHLDGSTAAAMNAMLKTLEEPPTRTHQILMTSERVLLTIQSRCLTLRWGSLDAATLAEILEKRTGMDPGCARLAAAASDGTVRGAAAAAEMLDACRPAVMTALKAAAEGDEDLLSAVAQKWGAPEMALLARWAHEMTTRRWRLWGEGDAPILPESCARDILRAERLRIRPRIALRIALSATLEAAR